MARGQSKNVRGVGDAVSSISGALHPDPGLWHFSWALVDRGGDLAWPGAETPEYAELAVWIARLSELELSDIFDEVRFTGRGANHVIGIEQVGEQWHRRWLDVFAAHRLGLREQQGFVLVSLTYCLAGRDSRRVVMAYQLDARVMYPIWWDPRHELIDTRGVLTVVDDSHDHSRCHHISRRCAASLQESWGYAS